MLTFASLPAVVPVLGALGWRQTSQTIFDRYVLVCHQMPSRSFFLLGQQMAYCERNTALYGSIALGGLLWMRLGRRLPRLHVVAYVAFIAPIAIDGLTQLVGLRESTVELRVTTGLLCGTASVWFAFPILQDYMDLFEPLFLHLRNRDGRGSGPATIAA